jgi:hypothetical protein
LFTLEVASGKGEFFHALNRAATERAAVGGSAADAPFAAGPTSGPAANLAAAAATLPSLPARAAAAAGGAKKAASASAAAASAAARFPSASAAKRASSERATADHGLKTEAAADGAAWAPRGP